MDNFALDVVVTAATVTVYVECKSVGERNNSEACCWVDPGLIPSN